MAHYIGIDLGTTSITALLLDTHSGDVIVRETMVNDTETTSAEDRLRGRSEWDLDRMVSKVFQVLRTVSGRMSDDHRLEGIGVTGQQHGMVLLDDRTQISRPFIGWQDRRCLEIKTPGATYLDHMHAQGGDDFSRSEYLPARGYMGSTLFWLSQTGQLPHQMHASFGPDYLVSRLNGKRPVTDSTNASGSGLFDVMDGVWNEALVQKLGLPTAILPEVQMPCTWSGGLTADAAQLTGLSTGTPVTVACGDNQASYAGSVSGYEDSVLVNIGTGGQVSVYSQIPIRMEGLLVRPYLKTGYLLVGAGLTGGRSYGVWEEFIRLVGSQVFGIKEDIGMYSRLNELAEASSSGGGGIHCDPVFTGSLKDPRRRGTWSGIDDTNLTPGHMTRSLLEGMAEQFKHMYDTMLSNGVQERTRFIGAGNGVRKNPLLCRILSQAFGLPIQIVRHTEEAALGAALCASVASGEFSDIEAAGRTCNQHDQVT